MRAGGKQILVGLLGIAAGAAAMAALRGGVSSNADRTAMEEVVREYVLTHPEIIPEAMKKLQEREVGKHVSAKRDVIEKPFAGAWAGAPKGDVVLVEFFDYACSFCRTSVADIDRLLAEDKMLKVVFRELPILGEGSEAAARASLAAAKQGRFLDFHREMYAAGVPDGAKAQQVQRAVKIDATRAARDAVGADIAQEIESNIDLARSLGLTGTPTFVVGDTLLSGAVGYAALKEAIAKARAARQQ